MDCHTPKERERAANDIDARGVDRVNPYEYEYLTLLFMKKKKKGEGQ